MNNSNIDHQKSGNLSTDESTSKSTSTINEVRGMSFKYFIAIVLTCTVIFLICQIMVYLGFREHRKSIIDIYQISPSTQFIDSGTSFENIDSLISGLDIPCSQKIELQHSIKVVAGDISSTIKNNIELDALKQAKYDNIQNGTRDLLELQYAKIQHEYESIQIWYGILTVIFLVFSFYSLYKVDDIVKQGKDGLKDLDLIKDKADGKIKSLGDEIDKTLNAFKHKSKEHFAKYQNIFKQRVGDIDNVIKSKEDIMNKQVEGTQEKLDNIFEDAQHRCSELVNSGKLEMSEIKINQEKLSQQYSILQQQLDVVNTIIRNYQKNSGQDGSK